MPFRQLICDAGYPQRTRIAIPDRVLQESEFRTSPLSQNRKHPAAVPPALDRIPTNLITGFLGAGKTSGILSLLKVRPPSERWGVIVNEYGMVSLDHIYLNDVTQGHSDSEETNDVHIEELAGGCFCCTLADSLPLTLIRLIRRIRPHRILLEPSGSGHPAAVIDLLRSGRLAEIIDLRTVIGLVDPRDFANPRITNKDVFRDQIEMADIIAFNFTDKCSREQIEACRRFVETMDPPKCLMSETTHGRLAAEWLDFPSSGDRSTTQPQLHRADRTDEHLRMASNAEPDGADKAVDLSHSLTQASMAPRPGMPQRCSNEGLEQSACGWIFCPTDRFQRELTVELLRRINPILRLKGVLHCEDDWWSIQRRGADMEIRRTAYRRDSRLEIIAEDSALDWIALEQQLLACLRTHRDADHRR